MIQMRANIWQRNLAQTKNSAENLASLVAPLTYVHHGQIEENSGKIIRSFLIYFGYGMVCADGIMT